MLGGEKTENGYSITSDKTPKLCFLYLSDFPMCDIDTVSILELRKSHNLRCSHKEGREEKWVFMENTFSFW